MVAQRTPSRNPKPPVSEESLRQVHAALREAGANGITRSRLVAKLGISLRTLERALEAMVIDGARIERVSAEVPARRTICLVLAKEPAWADGFSHHARLALQLAELALQQGGSEFWAQYLPAFALGSHRVVITQIKEKFGGLRVYTTHSSEGVSSLIMIAEEAASGTCEGCGAPGRNNKFATLCDSCRAKFSEDDDDTEGP